MEELHYTHLTIIVIYIIKSGNDGSGKFTYPKTDVARLRSRPIDTIT